MRTVLQKNILFEKNFVALWAINSNKIVKGN